MACYRPIPAYQAGPGTQPVLWPALGTANMHLPCGQCLGCKTAKANEWAHRCEHEAKQYQHNSFITLTYDDAHLPQWGFLDAKELQRFIKRLRKSHSSRSSGIQSTEGTLRYFACGEYGTQTGRPHYHLLTFNLSFSDGKRIRIDKRGEPVYTSETLGKLWPHGLTEYGAATPAAANYIAQYSLKKQPARHAQRAIDGYEYVTGLDTDTGELVPKPAPFLRMSLKPAIGAKWLDAHSSDLRQGYLVNNGRRFTIPRTYRKRLELQNPHMAEEIAMSTIQHRRKLNPDEHNNDDRRHAAEVIHLRRKQLTEHRQ